MDDDSRVVTWEDVFAVCKLLGVVVQKVNDEDLRHEAYAIYRFDSYPTYFVRPEDLLDFVTAPKHEIEK